LVGAAGAAGSALFFCARGPLQSSKIHSRSEEETGVAHTSAVNQSATASNEHFFGIGVNMTRVCCPRCGSDQISAHKEGYSAGGGCAGFLLVGPLGLLLGAGSKKVNVTCLKCGKQWPAGHPRQARETALGCLLLMGIAIAIVIYAASRTRDSHPGAPSPAAASAPATDAAQSPSGEPAELPTPPAPKPSHSMRTWTSSDGKTLEAQFLSSTYGTVALKKPDGTVVKVPIERFGEQDQKFIRNGARE
jgi:hypothetical protein